MIKRGGIIQYNTAMRWLDEKNGIRNGIIAYCDKGILKLSGHDPVCSWHVEDPDVVQPVNRNASCFYKRGKNNSASAVMSWLEFCIDQFSDIEFNVLEVTGPWTFTIKMASGRIIYQSKGLQGTRRETISLDQILKERGYANHYVNLELGLAVYGQGAQSMTFSLMLPAKAAIVPQLPMFYTMQEAKKGVPVHAVVVGSDGNILSDSSCQVKLRTNGSIYLMKPKKGIYYCVLKYPNIGDYKLEFAVVQKKLGVSVKSSTTLTVTDGAFIRYEPELCRYARGKDVLGFLSGNLVFCNVVPHAIVNGKEGQVFGEKDYWKKTKPINGRLDAIRYMSLSQSEMLARIDYLYRCGCRVVKIANWLPQNLDAGGHISPFGAEVLGFTFRKLLERNMFAMMDIYHDTFGRWTGGWLEGKKVERIQTVLSAYVEAGFMGGTKALVEQCHGDRNHYYFTMIDQLFLPKVMSLLKGYFKHVLTLYKGNTGILAFSVDGEGDGEFGPRLVNPLYEFIRKHDANHMVTVDRSTSFVSGDREPFFDREFVRETYKPRHHRIMPSANTGKSKSDFKMAVTLKFFSLHPAGVYAEGDCYPEGPPWTSENLKAAGRIPPWSEEYRLVVRDAIWMCLVHRIPAFYTWNEILVEDEHLLPCQVSELMDWKTFNPEIPPVMIRIWRLKDEGIEQLVSYEELFNSIPVQCGYVWANDSYPDGRRHLLEKGRTPFVEIDLLKEGFKRDLSLTGEIERYRYFNISKGYSVSYLMDVSHRQCLAYFRNTTNYVTTGDSVNGLVRARRKEVDLKISINNLPDGMRYVLYDIDGKRKIKSSRFDHGVSIGIGKTKHDFCLYLTENRN